MAGAVTTATPPTPSSTPATPRDPFLDLLRLAALMVVVVWHWTFTTVGWGDAGPTVSNPVGIVSWMWALTWVAQPMCVFFAVGGFLHAGDDRPAGRFISARLHRLIGPALPLVGIAAALLVAARWAGRDDLARVVVLAISPLWFLAVYVTLVVCTPAARAAHRRLGSAAVPLLAAVVLGLDLARFSGVISGRWVALTLFVVTWACVHQLGFHLDALRSNRRVALGLSVSGLAGLVGLSAVGPYPKAMVGSAGNAMSNMGPPNAMVVALAAFQLGLLCACSGRITAFASRHAARLEGLSAWAMPVYVWHLGAFCGFFAAAMALGVDNERIDTAWWLARPLWFVGPAVCCAALLALLRRIGVVHVARPGPSGEAASTMPA